MKRPMKLEGVVAWKAGSLNKDCCPITGHVVLATNCAHHECNLGEGKKSINTPSIIALCTSLSRILAGILLTKNQTRCWKRNQKRFPV